MSTQEITLVRSEISNLSGPQLVERYNATAKLLDKPAVKRFADRQVGLKRLETLFKEVEALAPKVVKEADGRKKRQKVFSYPPLETLKAVVEGSLRAQCRDLLIGGATLKEVEDLIYRFDEARGKPTARSAERAYGLVRLLHTYVGYALREEGTGENKKIFVMTRETWSAWRAKGGN